MMQSTAGFLLMLLLFLSCQNTSEQDETVNTDQSRPWKLICMGDDWTIGTGLEPALAYPALLAKELAAQHTVKVVNAGMKGEPLRSASARVDWILQQRMDAFLLAYGETDAAMSIPVDEQLSAWDELLGKLRTARPALPILVLVTGENSANKAYHTRLQAILEEHNAQYISVSSTVNQPPNWDAAGGHLSPQGQQLLATHLLPIVSQLIRTASTQ